MFEPEELMARIVDLEEQLKVSEMAPPAAEQLIACLEGEIAKRDARIVELQRYEHAFNEWHDKTELVQAESATLSAKYLGCHRSDVMRSLIDDLRELLERVLYLMDNYIGTTHPEEGEIRALLSAPSPAGVDGCKCSMSISMLGDGCRHCQPQEYIDRLGEMLDEERSELSDAQAIIDGLRGEVADLHTTMMAAAVEIQEHWAAHCDEEGYGPANLMHRLERGIASQYGYSAETLVRLESQRDQQAQRIGELGGLLRAESARVDFLDAYIVTADAPDTGKVAMLADSGTLRECIDFALSAGKEGE